MQQTRKYLTASALPSYRASDPGSVFSEQHKMNGKSAAASGSRERGVLGQLRGASPVNAE